MERRPEAAQRGDSLDRYRDQVLGILARGERMGASQIASEIEGLDATQVSSLLSRLEHDGHANRTAHGTYEITAAGATLVEPRPSPKEPPQGPAG